MSNACGMSAHYADILDENRRDRSDRPLGRADFDDLKLLFEPETKRQPQALDGHINGTDADFRAWPPAPIRQIALNLLLNASSAARLRSRPLINCPVRIRICSFRPARRDVSHSCLSPAGHRSPGRARRVSRRPLFRPGGYAKSWSHLCVSGPGMRSGWHNSSFRC